VRQQGVPKAALTLTTEFSGLWTRPGVRDEDVIVYLGPDCHLVQYPLCKGEPMDQDLTKGAGACRWLWQTCSLVESGLMGS